MYYTLTNSLILCGIGLLVLLDQCTKFVALTYCLVPHRIVSWLTCEVVFNRGATMSLLSTTHPLYYTFFCMLIVVLLAAIAWYIFRQQDPWWQWGGIGIVGGGISNFIDRILHDGVVDFIDFHIGTYHWPAFINLADIFIVIGIGVIAWREFRK